MQPSRFIQGRLAEKEWYVRKWELRQIECYLGYPINRIFWGDSAIVWKLKSTEVELQRTVVES